MTVFGPGEPVTDCEFAVAEQGCGGVEEEEERSKLP